MESLFLGNPLSCRGCYDTLVSHTDILVRVKSLSPLLSGKIWGFSYTSVRPPWEVPKHDMTNLLYWVGKNIRSFFSHKMALVGLSFLELNLNIFVRLYYELPYQCALKKIKICEFLCSHFNIEYGSKDIFGILCFIISRKIKYNWNIHTHKMNCTVYGEVTTMNWLYQKWFVKFCPGDFLLLHDLGDQLKLMEIKLRHSLRIINIINIILCER